uniref:Uncharacterized protein n=1 Tax=Skeletonema marinoi TaxID=267567 RepID=A0A7S2LAY6_9STRA
MRTLRLSTLKAFTTPLQKTLRTPIATLMCEPNNNLSFPKHADIVLDEDVVVPFGLQHTDIVLDNNVSVPQQQLRRRHTLSRQASFVQVINHFGNIIYTQNNSYTQNIEIVNNSNNTTTNVYIDKFNYMVVNMFNSLVAVGGPVEMTIGQQLGAIYLQDSNIIQTHWWMMVNSMILLSNVLRIWDWRNRGNNGNDNNNGRMEQPLFNRTPFFHTVQESLRLLFILEWIFVRIVDKDWQPPEQRFYTYIPGAYRYNLRSITNALYDVKQWVINLRCYYAVTGTAAFFAGVERGCYKRMMLVALVLLFRAYFRDWADYFVSIFWA